MSHFPLSPRVLFFLLLTGTALLSTVGLGHLPLLDVDEPVYGTVSRDMARANVDGWLSPHYNGALWFDKPPLFYWLSALSVRCFGPGEWAARFPSALTAVVLVGATVALCRRLYPAKSTAALWAGSVLATSVQFFLLARAAVTDMTLAALLTLALLCAWQWLDTDKTKWAAGAGVCVGLAALCKGPVALVLVGAQVVLFLLLTRQAARLLRPGLWIALLVSLIVGLPWYVLMIHLHGHVFVQGFLEANNVTRFLKPEHAETQNPLFYALWFPALFLPWTVALPGAARQAWASIKQEQRPCPTLFVVLWIGIVFLFFSLSQTKLVTYIFPLYPCAAVLAGQWLAVRQAVPRSKTLWVLAAVLALLLVGLAFGGVKYGVSPVTLLLWIVLLGTGIGTALFSTNNARWLGSGGAVALSLLAGWLSPTWNTRASDISERDTARAAARAAGPDAPIYALGLKHPSLVFYSGRRVQFTDDWDAAIADMTAHPEHVYAVRTRDWNRNRAPRHFNAFRVVYASRQTSVVMGTARTASTE